MFIVYITKFYKIILKVNKINIKTNLYSIHYLMLLLL